MGWSAPCQGSEMAAGGVAVDQPEAATYTRRAFELGLGQVLLCLPLPRQLPRGETWLPRGDTWLPHGCHVATTYEDSVQGSEMAAWQLTNQRPPHVHGDRLVRGGRRRVIRSTRF
ncbi:hypothetical protein Tco_0361259 [Tanacetum coccineum]